MQNYPIPFHNFDESIEYFQEVAALINKTNSWWQQHSFCSEIRQGWIFVNTGWPLCIFLYEIENNQMPTENYFWLVAGGIPFMHVSVQQGQTTREALTIYTEAAREWITRSREFRDPAGCYPFESETDHRSLARFEKWVNLFDNCFLPEIRNLLFSTSLLTRK